MLVFKPVINHPLLSVSKCKDTYENNFKFFSKCHELYPNSECTWIESIKTTLCFDKQINSIGDQIFFFEEKFNKGDITLYGLVHKMYEETLPLADGIAIFADPIIPILSYTYNNSTYDSCKNLCFSNYNDVISQHFSNDQMLINQCDTHIIEFVRNMKADQLIYLPSRLRKLLIFL